MVQVCRNGLRGNTQDGDPCIVMGRKHQRIGVIEIKGDNTRLFSATGLNEIGIRGRRQRLVDNRSHVMPIRSKDICTTIPEVLIEFHAHDYYTPCPIST